MEDKIKLTQILLTDAEMAIALEKAYTQQGKLVREATISLLNNSNHAVAMLFKASLGIEPKYNYNVGDQVVLKQTHLPSWSTDEALMISANLLYTAASGATKIYLFNATITSVNKWTEYPYALSFTIINTKGETKTDTSTVKEESIQGHTEEWPEE